MMSHRLIQQDHMTKLYRLGPGIAYLASVAKEGLSIRKIALPIMEHLQVKGREKLFNLVKEAAKAISQKMGAPVIKSKSNSAREPREIYKGSDKRIEKKRMFV